MSFSKQVKVDGPWRLVAIPVTAMVARTGGRCREGRYFIEWREHGKRRREAAGVTAADALEAARRCKHVLEGRVLGMERYAVTDEDAKRTPLRVAVKRYLEHVKA